MAKDEIKTAVTKGDESAVNSYFDNESKSKPSDGNNMGGQSTAANSATEDVINKTWNEGAKGKTDYV